MVVILVIVLLDGNYNELLIKYETINCSEREHHLKILYI